MGTSPSPCKSSRIRASRRATKREQGQVKTRSCPKAGEAGKLSTEAGAHVGDPVPVPSQPLLGFAHRLPLLEGTAEKNPCPMSSGTAAGDGEGAASLPPESLVPGEGGKAIEPAECELLGRRENFQIEKECCKVFPAAALLPSLSRLDFVRLCPCRWTRGWDTAVSPGASGTAQGAAPGLQPAVPAVSPVPFWQGVTGHVATSAASHKCSVFCQLCW